MGARRDAHLPNLPSVANKSQASRTANTSSQVYEHACPKIAYQAEITGSTTTRMSVSQAEMRAGAAWGPPREPPREPPRALEYQAGAFAHTCSFEQTRPLQPLEPVVPVEPEFRAAIRVTSGVPSVPLAPAILENCGDLDMRAEICHFLPGMRAGRRLSDLLQLWMGVLFILVLFLSGTAVHIIKAVAQLEIVSVSVAAPMTTLVLSLAALIFLTRRCAFLRKGWCLSF